MPRLSDAERDRFLSDTRLGILTTLEAMVPVGVPVWFEWDGETARIFTGMGSAKVKRLRADPRASLLVVNHIAETERWVSFDGTVSVVEEGGFELAEKLANRYWDLSDPKKKETLDVWRQAASELGVLELAPTRIRSYKD